MSPTSRGNPVCLVPRPIHRELRHARPGEQPAQRPAAARQEPGGGHGGGHPQHHPRDRDGQLGERPLAHPGTGRGEAGGHQQNQVPYARDVCGDESYG